MKELLKISGSTKVFALSPVELTELQEALRKLNFYPALPDGKYGPATANGWKQFKAANDLNLYDEIGPSSIKLLAELANKKPETGKYKISDNGIRHLANSEGKRNSKYKDSVGLWTIGIGHLIKPGEKFPAVMTDKEVYDLFRKDLVGFESAINSLVKVPLTQNQYDALVSFAFNIGVGGFASSKTLKLLNAGDYAGAAKAFMGWVIPPEITGRRLKEKELFLKP